MELELKHIAPYTPYNLIGSFWLSQVAGVELKKDEIRTKKLTPDNFEFFLNYCKPHLYPLSMLTKPIEHNGERFVPAKYWESGGGNFYQYQLFHDDLKKRNLLSLPYLATCKFFEWHFDLFGLIHNGLAIDKSTI